MQCPSCSSSIVTTLSGSSATNTILPPASQQPQVLTRYHNEGGVQENLDILPLITEEAYLDANPAARPARAFLTMCAEGDVAGIIELLKAIEEDRDEDEMSPQELLRYQDPLDGMKTGLHMAMEKDQQEAVWLLLWLASSLPTGVFPEEVAQAAQVMGAGRETAEGTDIRSLRDEQHRTAEDVARSMGGYVAFHWLFKLISELSFFASPRRLQLFNFKNSIVGYETNMFIECGLVSLALVFLGVSSRGEENGSRIACILPLFGGGVEVYYKPKSSWLY